MISRRPRRCLGTVVAALGLAVLIGQPAIAFAAPQQPSTTPANQSANQRPNQPALSSTPQFTIGETNNVVRLKGTDAIVPISATVSGLEKLAGAELDKYARSLVVTDKGAVRGPSLAGTVQFDRTPEFIGRAGASGLTWRIKVMVSNVMTGITQVRHAQATLAGSPTVAFEYSISTKPESPPQWTPKGSSPVWRVSWSAPASERRFRVVIENQDEPLTNLRLLQSSLRDTSGRVIEASNLKLVDPLDGGEHKSVNVSPNTPKPVLIEFVEPRFGGFGWFGTFDGALRFAIDGTSVSKDVELKLQASSPYAKTAGVLLALLGLAGTAVTALLRAYLARVSALRTVLVVREAIASFQNELQKACGGQCAGIGKALDQLAKQVSTEHLDTERLLPPRVAFASEQTVKDTSAALKTHLEKVSNKLTGLSILLHDGIIPLAASNSTNRDALIQELDAAARMIQGETDARTAVQNALAKQQQPSGQLAEMADLRDPTTVQQADRTIRHIAGVSWFLWGITSVAVAIVWVVSDVDFGTPMDLLGCFLWGFGLTTFGAGVQSLTTAGIATQVNLKLPN